MMKGGCKRRAVSSPDLDSSPSGCPKALWFFVFIRFLLISIFITLGVSLMRSLNPRSISENIFVRVSECD